MVALALPWPRVSRPDADEHRLVGRLVQLDEGGLALVLGGDRADLDLHDAPVLVALDLLELGARKARSDALDVGEDLPGLVDRHAHVELVGQLHRSRSSTVSMSVASPEHATSPTSSGLSRHHGPGALVAGARAAAATPRGRAGPGCPAGPGRSPPRWGRSSGARATARHASGPTKGWSARPTTRASAPATSAARRATASEVAWPSAQRGFSTQHHVGPEHPAEVDRPGHDEDDVEDPGADRGLHRLLDQAATAEGGQLLGPGLEAAGAAGGQHGGHECSGGRGSTGPVNHPGTRPTARTRRSAGRRRATTVSAMAPADGTGRIEATIVLADAAQVADGRLNMLGGGVRIVPARPQQLGDRPAARRPLGAGRRDDRRGPASCSTPTGMPVIVGDVPVLVQGQFNTARPEGWPEGDVPRGAHRHQLHGPAPGAARAVPLAADRRRRDRPRLGGRAGGRAAPRSSRSSTRGSRRRPAAPVPWGTLRLDHAATRLRGGSCRSRSR